MRNWTIGLVFLWVGTQGELVQESMRLNRDLVLPTRDLTRPDRIVGGEPVNRGDLPWQVSIQLKRDSSASHFCGGTLIHDSWVITAAHCTRDINFDNVVVATGAWDLHEVNTEYRVSKVIPGSYNVLTLQHDIALLKLDVENPVSFVTRENQRGIPIALESKAESVAGMRCTISGWGRLTEGGTLPNILMAADVEVKSDHECSKVFTGRYLYGVYPTNLCAGGGERDACQGDSGGPLVCCDESTADLGSCRVAGVVSWGIGCATRGVPGVYTEVAHYIDWIKETISKEDGKRSLERLSIFE